MTETETLHLEHTGWLEFPAGDLVARYIREGWFEYTERAFLFAYLRRGDCYLDIGAHAGFHAATARHIVGNKGRVVCVEPNPLMHASLKQNVQSAEIHKVAISDHSGESVFSPGDNQTSSFAHLLESNDTFDGALQVQTLTLPGFLQTTNIAAPDLIKVDIEGAEQAMIDGASQFLSTYAGVVLIEFSKENLENFGRTTASLEASITECGLQLCRYDPYDNLLHPADLNHPIWYENFFLCREPAKVNKRLATISSSRKKVILDIVRKGEIAKASYLQNELLSKERAIVRDVTGHIRGLNDYLRADGVDPIETEGRYEAESDPVTELQKEYGVVKEIAQHHLAELQKRESLVHELSELVHELSNSENRLFDILEIDHPSPRQQFDSEELGSTTIALIQHLLSDLRLIETKAATLMSLNKTTKEAISAVELAIDSYSQERTAWHTERQDLYRVLSEKDHEIRALIEGQFDIKNQLSNQTEKMLEKERDVGLLNLEVSEKNTLIWDQGAEIQKQQASVERLSFELSNREEMLVELKGTHDADLKKLKADLKDREQSLEELQRDMDRQAKIFSQESSSLHSELHERNAYYAKLISAVTNNLFELRQSRILRMTRWIAPRADRKIAETIEVLSE